MIDNENPLINYDEFSECSPATVNGKYLSYHFHLDSRYIGYSFTLSNSKKYSSEEINELGDYDQKKLLNGELNFDEGLIEAFESSFYYDNTYVKASYMSKIERQRIVRECISIFNQHNKQPIKFFNIPRIKNH